MSTANLASTGVARNCDSNYLIADVAGVVVVAVFLSRLLLVAWLSLSDTPNTSSGPTASISSKASNRMTPICRTVDIAMRPWPGSFLVGQIMRSGRCADVAFHGTFGKTEQPCCCHFRYCTQEVGADQCTSGVSSALQSSRAQHSTQRDKAQHENHGRLYYHHYYLLWLLINIK